MNVVLVTGSSRGIGLGIAKAFACNGDKVILNGKSDKNKLYGAVDELRRLYQNVHGVSCGIEGVAGFLADASDPAECDRLVSEAENMFGQVDVLVNNAGISYFGLFQDMALDEVNNVITTNLLSAINMTRRVLPRMVKAKKGSIINITSVWGLTGASCEAVYSASKSGIAGFTKSLAKELGPSGIRVNAIACGAFETRMNERLSKDEKAAFIENIPLGRFGKPDEAGDLAVFLASSKASYLTGQVIALDGGFYG